MGVGIKFLESSNDVFILKYGTKWPDGNGFYNDATVSFLYVKGIVVARKAIINPHRSNDYVTLCPMWTKPKKRIEYVCKFLKQGKDVIEKKLKNKDEEYSIRKLPNHYDYKW